MVNLLISPDGGFFTQPVETPNPSIERTATGLAPRSVQVHDPLRGTNPAAASHVKR
jgi:hypothetical protein